MKTSNELIYKTYKHGGGLQLFEISQVYNALKKHKLQVVLVTDVKNNERIYNFIPEMGKFYRIY